MTLILMNFLICSEKMPNRATQGREGFFLTQCLKIFVYHGRNGSWPITAHLQSGSREIDECLYTVCFLLCILCRTPVHERVLSTFGVGLPSLAVPLWRCHHRHTKGYVFQVTPNLIKLTDRMLILLLINPLGGSAVVFPYSCWYLQPRMLCAAQSIAWR